MFRAQGMPSDGGLVKFHHRSKSRMYLNCSQPEKASSCYMFHMTYSSNRDPSPLVIQVQFELAFSGNPMNATTTRNSSLFVRGGESNPAPPSTFFQSRKGAMRLAGVTGQVSIPLQHCQCSPLEFNGSRTHGTSRRSSTEANRPC